MSMMLLSNQALHPLLALLLMLLGSTMAVRLETTSTTTSTTTCWHEIPTGLIRDLWCQTRLLSGKLPKEETSFMRHRFLPNFCTQCTERTIGWPELRELIDIYQRSVFRRDAVQRLLPLHYNELLFRLQHTLKHCVNSSQPSKYFHIIKKMERKVLKRSRNERALKAVGEFTFILRWIDELLSQQSES